jgi:hypothetical protein
VAGVEEEPTIEGMGAEVVAPVLIIYGAAVVAVGAAVGAPVVGNPLVLALFLIS